MTLKITPILCNEKNMQNYAYLLQKEDTVIIIDAAEATPIQNVLTSLNLVPHYILTTHHHFDHVEGNLYLKEKYNLKIIAPIDELSQVPGADIAAQENIPLQLGSIKIKVIHAPGHTMGHVLYYLPEEKKLFTGDVLFNLCIGGLFEGTPTEMFDSLQKIKALPNETEFFPGHEYTRSGLPQINPNSPLVEIYIKKMLQRENREYAPATLGEEKELNPYLKANTLTEFLG